MKRNLDGVYFCIDTENGTETMCFSDMTEEQQDEVMLGKGDMWLKSMCKILARHLREIGDQFDIIMSTEEKIK